MRGHHIETSISFNDKEGISKNNNLLLGWYALDYQFYGSLKCHWRRVNIDKTRFYCYFAHNWGHSELLEP